MDHELSSSGLDVPAGQHQRGESPSQQVADHRTHERAGGCQSKHFGFLNILNLENDHFLKTH